MDDEISKHDMASDTSDLNMANDRFRLMIQNGMPTSYPYQSALNHTALAGVLPETNNSRFAMTGLYASPRKLQVALNPRFVSKFSSLRMRPYYVPERSRTKSENNSEPIGAHTKHYQELFNADNNAHVDDDVDELPSTSGRMATAALLPNNNLVGAASMMDTSGDHGFFESNDDRLDLNNALSATRTAVMVAHLLTVHPGTRISKSRSMEDICRGARSTDAGSQSSHEMEFMSNRIQKMKVQD